MNKPSPAHMERARRWLLQEGGSGEDACAAAAARIYEKLRARLRPLVGEAGVQSLLVRSARRAHGEFAWLEDAAVEDATRLGECLQALDPAVARETAAALFGNVFTLMEALIGERLTTQALQGEWPTIEEA